MLNTFSYVAPGSRKELLAVLKKEGANAKIMAGGTDLLVDMRAGKLKPALVVDLKKIADLKGVSFHAKDGLSIGAATTCIELISNKTILEKYSLIADAAGRIGSPQLRNRATIAGNLCSASPCADLGCAMLALGASIEIVSSTGTRVVKLADFFTGVKTTVLKADELVTRLIVPAELAGAKSGMEKLKRIKGHDLALASVAMVKKGDLLRIALGSCAPTPVVLPDLTAKTPLAAIIELAKKTIHPIDDVRASKEYRTAMAMTFIERLLERM
ncbi:MAG: xanthine dehydrogenase family protein subunit M [Candidatus Ozemobacteraceae bacterium]